MRRRWEPGGDADGRDRDVTHTIDGDGFGADSDALRVKTRLRIVRSDGSTQDLDLSFGTYVIGRDIGDVVLNDPLASSAHARLDVDPRGVMVTDLGSTNGTFDPEGRPLQSTTIVQLHQWIRIGSSYLTVTGFFPEAGAPVVGPASVQASSSTPRSTPRSDAKLTGTGLILAFVGVLFVATGIGTYFAFRGVSSKLSGSVPKDVQVFVELPSVSTAIESFAAMDILDSEKIEPEDIAEKLRRELERSFDLKSDDASALMSRIDSVAIAARWVSTKREVVTLVSFSRSAGVEALLETDRFDDEGELAGGKQYSLERAKLDADERIGSPPYRRALAALATDEHTGGNVLVWFADEKILVFGSKGLVKDVGDVIVEGDAALDETDKWAKASFPRDATGIAFVDTRALGDIDHSLEAVVEDYFRDAGPLSAGMRFVDAGTVVTLQTEMRVKKVQAENSMAAPITLDLYKKLPKETLAYLALSTKREGSARDFVKRTIADAKSIDAAGTKELRSVLDAVERLSGSSYEDLLEVLGDQAVLAIAHDGDVGDEPHDSARWIQRGGIALLVRVADEDKAKALVAELEKKNLRDVIVRLEDGHLLIAAGGIAERFVQALTEGKDTLADEAAHDSALAVLGADASMIGWIDTARLRRPILDLVGKEQMDQLEHELGLDVDVIRTEGDERISSMVAVTFENGEERWGVRVDLLNYGAGMIALAAMLESAPSSVLADLAAASEADQFVHDMERFADEMCACEDGACRQRTMLAMGVYEQEHTANPGGWSWQTAREVTDVQRHRAAAAMSKITTCMQTGGRPERRDQKARR